TAIRAGRMNHAVSWELSQPVTQPERTPMTQRDSSAPHGWRLVWLAGLAAALVVLHLALAGQAQQVRRPVIVKIEDEQAKVEEISLPVDAQLRAQPQYVGMGYGLNVEGKRLTFGGGSA